MLSIRCAALLAFACAALVAPRLKADAVLVTDDYGSGSIILPGYYVPTGTGLCQPETPLGGGLFEMTCNGGTIFASQGYECGIVADTLPATVYVGDPGGNVSDAIVTTITSVNSGLIDVVEFAFTFGLDLTSSPLTCASVGGCDLTYNGSIQNVGVITWGTFGITPSTTLQFQNTTPEPSTFSTLALCLGLA